MQKGDEALCGDPVTEGEEGGRRVLPGEVDMGGGETCGGGRIAGEEGPVDGIERRCCGDCGAARMEDTKEDWWRRGWYAVREAPSAGVLAVQLELLEDFKEERHC